MKDGSDAEEARAFVGRDGALALLARLLAADSPAAVAFVHGPGGIGKSMLLREFARRAEAAGRCVWRVEGRDRDTAPDRLQDALHALAGAGGGVVLLDTYEQVPALGADLRAELAAAGARLVIAGRRPPDGAWLQDGWSEALLTLRLAPLADADALELVQRRGLDDAHAAARVAAWAEGSPLALAVAADALLAGQTLDLDRLDADAMLATTLLQRLAGDELHGQDREVIAVAAIARAVDARLLAAVLPGIDGDHAEAWLRSLSFAEPLGVRVTLHERVRKAVRGGLLASDPEHEHELRRRIADQLYWRAVLGEARLSADLAELIDDETIRWGLAPPPLAYRAAPVATGDERQLAARLDAGGTAWWRSVRRWFEHGRDNVTIVRDAAGLIAGFGIWATLAFAPAWVDEDAILGPWLADARKRSPAGDVLLLRDSFDLSGRTDAHSPVVAVGNHAIIMRSGLANPRYAYAPLAPGDSAGEEFLDAMGYSHVPELDARDGEREVRCYLNDWGPGGVMGVIRDFVYRDLGLPPGPTLTRGALAAETVRDALRCFHEPGSLAASPLARGGSVEERAASVRRLLRNATAASFGDSVEERLQRATVERGYLDPDGGHSRAQLELHVGRTTYFRRLADASARVSDYVLASRL
jgi:hypothetical protein